MLRHLKPRQVVGGLVVPLRRRLATWRLPTPPARLQDTLQPQTAFLQHDLWNTRTDVLESRFYFLHEHAEVGRPVDGTASHQIKRLFDGFSAGIWLFRCLIQRLFLWRSRIREPEVLILGMDSMGLDNNGTEKREGVEPTRWFEALERRGHRDQSDPALDPKSPESSRGEDPD